MQNSKWGISNNNKRRGGVEWIETAQRQGALIAGVKDDVERMLLLYVY